MKLEPSQPQESLLQDTILVLKQRQGASLAQIRKRLELNNSDGKLDDTKSKMLSSTLKNLVLKGKVEKTGGVYKLARGNPADQENEVPSRRRRAFPTAPANATTAITSCVAAEDTAIAGGVAIAVGVATAAGAVRSRLAAANATAATTNCDTAKGTAIGGDLTCGVAGNGACRAERRLQRRTTTGPLARAAGVPS